ncbi:MAG: hypothetical protein ABIQ57_07875 [Candidatus Kapaibacterium sp.]
MEKKTIQVLLVLWASIASLLLFVPAILLLVNSRDVTNCSSLATLVPLSIPKIDTTKVSGLDSQHLATYSKYLDLQINIFDHTLTAYKEQVAAIKTVADIGNHGDMLAAYQLVKDTIVTLLQGLLAAFITYAFVKAGQDTLKEHFAAKRALAQVKLNVPSARTE